MSIKEHILAWLKEKFGELDKKYQNVVVLSLLGSAIVTCSICITFFMIFIRPMIGPDGFATINDVNRIVDDKMLKLDAIDLHLSGKYKLITSTEYEELKKQINDLEIKLNKSVKYSNPTFLGDLKITKNEFFSKDDRPSYFINEWNSGAYKGKISINGRGNQTNAIGLFIPHKDFSSDQYKLTRTIQYSLDGKYTTLSFNLGTDDWNDEKYQDGSFDITISSDEKGTLYNKTGLKYDTYTPSDFLDVSGCDKLDIIITTYKGKTTTLNVVLSDVSLYKANQKVDS